MQSANDGRAIVSLLATPIRRNRNFFIDRVPCFQHRADVRHWAPTFPILTVTGLQGHIGNILLRVDGIRLL